MKYINRKRIITEIKESEHKDQLYTNFKTWVIWLIFQNIQK